MGSDNKDFLRIIAQQRGLLFDDEANMVHGVYNGYSVCAKHHKSFSMQIRFSVSQNGQAMTDEQAKGLKSDTIADYTLSGNHVTLETVPCFTLETGVDAVCAAIDEAVRFFFTNGFKDACSECGAPEGIHTYVVGEEGSHFCPACYDKAVQDKNAKKDAENRKKGNVITGTVGAILGSLLGAASIVIIGQLGYIAAISGIIMAFCTIGGYKFFGGKLNITGAIIVFIVMLIMTFAASNLDWAISISKAYEGQIGIFDSFMNMPFFISEKIVKLSDYLWNLGIIMIINIAGTVSGIIEFRKESKNELVIRQAVGA